MTSKHRNDVPDDVRALVERLRATDFIYNRGPNYSPLECPPSALMLQAADTLERLATRPLEGDERERLRQESLEEALRPFAEYYADGGDRDFYGRPLPDEQGVGWVYLTYGDFRRAAALRTTPSPAGDQDGGETPPSVQNGEKG